MNFQFILEKDFEIVQKKKNSYCIVHIDYCELPDPHEYLINEEYYSDYDFPDFFL